MQDFSNVLPHTINLFEPPHEPPNHFEPNVFDTEGKFVHLSDSSSLCNIVLDLSSIRKTVKTLQDLFRISKVLDFEYFQVLLQEFVLHYHRNKFRSSNGIV